MHITLRQLEVFLATARSGNVTQAAAAIGLSQSAASSALAELESQLGRPLFDRVGRRIQLNENGHYLLPRALDLVQGAGTLESAFRQDVPARLHVTASLTIGNYLMPALLARLRAEAPALRIEMAVVNSATVLQHLAECRTDFGLIEAPFSDPQLVFEPWRQDELVVFARADHPLAGRPGDLTALAACDWVMREAGSGSRRLLETLLQPALGAFRIALELGSGEAVREAVRCGLGIACASRLMVERELASGEFCMLPTPGVNLTRQLQLVWHADRQIGAAVAALRKFCRELSAHNPPWQAASLPQN